MEKLYQKNIYQKIPGKDGKGTASTGKGFSDHAETRNLWKRIPGKARGKEPLRRGKESGATLTLCQICPKQILSFPALAGKGLQP